MRTYLQYRKYKEFARMLLVVFLLSNWPLIFHLFFCSVVHFFVTLNFCFFFMLFFSYTKRKIQSFAPVQEFKIKFVVFSFPVRLSKLIFNLLWGNRFYSNGNGKLKSKNLQCSASRIIWFWVKVKYKKGAQQEIKRYDALSSFARRTFSKNRKRT